MLDTRFIFIEGIPGSGKTTAARYVAERLRDAGTGAEFRAEGPTRERPDNPLRVATSLPRPQKVWLDVTVDEYVERSLVRWREFVAEAERSATPTVTVCDGLLFHGNMTDLLLMDAQPRALDDYVHQVVGCLRALRPSVVYLRRTEVERALRAVCAERGERWEAYQVNWKLASPYAARRGLGGFDGLVQLYVDYRAVCDSLLGQLDVPKLLIQNDDDWPANYAAIMGFLDVPAA